MTPIELVESDADGREKRKESDATRISKAREIEELYGEPQHEADCQRTEQREAFYGEPQHEQLEECLWGEPFPWLLDADDADDEEERRSSTHSTEIPLRRLDRK
jgi:hypothetical protein